MIDAWGICIQSEGFLWRVQLTGLSKKAVYEFPNMYL